MRRGAREGGGDPEWVARVTGVDPVARRVLRDSPLVAGTQAETMALLRPLLSLPDHVLLARMAAMAEQVEPVPAVALAPLALPASSLGGGQGCVCIPQETLCHRCMFLKLLQLLSLKVLLKMRPLLFHQLHLDPQILLLLHHLQKQSNSLEFP